LKQSEIRYFFKIAKTPAKNEQQQQTTKTIGSSNGI
jgi:hypothetical protein